MKLNDLQKSKINYLVHAVQVRLSNTKLEVPHDFSSLKSCILLKELKQELDFITTSLSFDNFVTTFTQRCRERADDEQERALNLSVMANTPINALYWNITTILFPTNTLQIMLPHVRQQLKLIKPQEIPTALMLDKSLSFFKKPLFEIKLDAMTALTFADIPHCVIADNLLVDMRDLSPLDLAAQWHLYHTLSEQFPALARKMYNHNAAFQSLEADILILNQKGQSPKEAIKQAIRGLTLGGRPNSEDAGISAQIAYLQFLEYFDNLPKTLQETLGLLKGTDKTLAETIALLRYGGCVLEVANLFVLVLEHNKNNPLLNASPVFKNDDLTLLYEKYENQSLPSTNDRNLKTSLPKVLLLDTMKSVVPKNLEDLLSLLLSFNPNWYVNFFLNANLEQVNNILGALKTAIQQEYFSSERIDALLLSVTKKWGLAEGLLLAAATNTPEKVISLLKSFSDTERLAAILTKDINGLTALHHTAHTPEIFKILLTFVPETERLIATQIHDIYGQEVLHYAARHPGTLQILLNLYSETGRQEVIQKKKNYGRTLLHYADRNPQSLQIMLNFLPRTKQQAAIQTKDINGLTLLHLAADVPKSLQILLDFFPKTERLAAIQTIDNYGRMVLYYASYTSESFVVLLSSLPEADQLAAVQTQYTDYRTFLDELIINTEWRANILPTLPVLRLYCTIHDAVSPYINTKRPTSPTLFSNNPNLGNANELITELKASTSLEQMQLTVFSMLTENKNDSSILDHALLSALIPSDLATARYSRKLQALEELWSMSQQQMAYEIPFKI
ncbi:MAG: hypothetical protein WC627_13165 [Legionella sp.]|jgi:hypothetical protein